MSLHEHCCACVPWEIVFRPLPSDTGTPFARRELGWLLVGPLDVYLLPERSMRKWRTGTFLQLGAALNVPTQDPRFKVEGPFKRGHYQSSPLAH